MSSAAAPNADCEPMLLNNGFTSKGTAVAPNVSFVAERPGAAFTNMRCIAITYASKY